MNSCIAPVLASRCALDPSKLCYVPPKGYPLWTESVASLALRLSAGFSQRERVVRKWRGKAASGQNTVCPGATPSLPPTDSYGLPALPMGIHISSQATVSRTFRTVAV